MWSSRERYSNDINFILFNQERHIEWEAGKKWPGSVSLRTKCRKYGFNPSCLPVLSGWLKQKKGMVRRQASQCYCTSSAVSIKHVKCKLSSMIKSFIRRDLLANDLTLERAQLGFCDSEGDVLWLKTDKFNIYWNRSEVWDCFHLAFVSFLIELWVMMPVVTVVQHTALGWQL